jgi:hypothetical protein
MTTPHMASSVAATPNAIATGFPALISFLLSLEIY